MTTLRPIIAVLAVALLALAVGCSTRSVSEIKPIAASDTQTESASQEALADGGDANANAPSPCYVTRVDVSTGESPVDCSLPHTAEIVATVATRATGSAYPGQAELFDEGTAGCATAFRELTGVVVETTIASLVVVFPDERGWGDGNRTIVCVLEFPRAKTAKLADLDPRRALGLVSFYGLEVGDCLVSLSQADGALEVAPCDGVHSIEIYDVLPVDGTTYPGNDEVDAVAYEHCFAEYQQHYGPATSPESAPFDYLVPTERSWNDFDDRSIICLAAVNAGA